MKNVILKDERNHKVQSGKSISILSELPAAIYELDFNHHEGFSLNEADSNFKQEKLYGEVETITRRVLNTFENVEGNLGVLFSGPKGLGKSLTVRNICTEAIKKGLPIILIKEHFEGVSTFIETICQPVVVVFDEFEKIYIDRNKYEKDELDGQNSLLNLFDPALAGKKLFLLTCNDVKHISEYLMNRPGRLHYHFKMYRLTVDEITGYCIDNLKDEHHNHIPDICSLGTRIPDFSYDMLKAIIFEINTYNCDLTEARKVLNIVARSSSPFNYTVYYKSGKTETGFKYLDTADSRLGFDWYGKSDGSHDGCFADMTKAEWTGNKDGSLMLDGKYILQKEERKKDSIEKVLFIPANEGYRSERQN